MLPDKDTEVVKAWLTQALTDGKDRGQTRTALAKLCGVSPQAVSGWVKTGRISKGHLSSAVTFFGHAPTFAGLKTLRLEQDTSSHDAYAHAAAWPFRTIDRKKVARLPPDQLDRLEAAILGAASALGHNLANRRAA
jgi:hypothetical protein